MLQGDTGPPPTQGFSKGLAEGNTVNKKDAFADCKFVRGRAPKDSEDSGDFLYLYSNQQPPPELELVGAKGVSVKQKLNNGVAPLAWVHSFLFVFIVPSPLPRPRLLMKPERIRVGKGVQERRNPAGEIREGNEARERQGERKDTRAGESARTGEPMTAGERGLNRAGGRRSPPPLPCTLRLPVGG